MEKLTPLLDLQTQPWTERAALPGGDMPGADFEAFLADFTARHGWLPAGLARRLVRAYGTRADALLGGAQTLGDLGEELGEGLFEAEIEYLIGKEWAVSAEDILWRRSKLGLHVSEGAKDRLAQWLDRNRESNSGRKVAAR